MAERRPEIVVVGNPEAEPQGRQPNERSEAGGAVNGVRRLVCTRPLAAAPSLRCGLASADDGALVAGVDVGGRVAG